MALTSSPIKIRGKSVQGFLSYDRKNKHTNGQKNRDYNNLYIEDFAQYLYTKGEGDGLYAHFTRI